MDDFAGANGFVTGGASGIGLGLATSLLEDGASGVVLADIEQGALDQATDELRAKDLGGSVIGVQCDVTDPASVDAAAAAAWAELGSVEVVCLNAGVFAAGAVWETTDDDWDWVMSVNLRGVVNGIRTFVPRLIDAGQPSHVIVTASIAGIVAVPAAGVYCTSKFAALGLAESLHHDIGLAGATHVGVSAICPGMVATNIDRGERNRPGGLEDATSTPTAKMASDAMAETLNSDAAMDPIEGARHALSQVKEGRFYTSTHAGDMWERLVGNENDDRLAGRAPRFQMYE